jgi:hypothetical protein
MRENRGLGKRRASATQESYNGSLSEKTQRSYCIMGNFQYLGGFLVGLTLKPGGKPTYFTLVILLLGIFNSINNCLSITHRFTDSLNQISCLLAFVYFAPSQNSPSRCVASMESVESSHQDHVD